MRSARTALLLVLLAAVACGRAHPTISEQAQDIEGQVWSPYCPGRLLIDCATPQARELRAAISTRLRHGQSPRRVLAWIERDHGPEALARPETRGPGLALWLALAALFVAGGVVLVRIVRRATRAGTAPPAASPDGVARVREEVERDL